MDANSIILFLLMNNKKNFELSIIVLDYSRRKGNPSEK